MLGVYVAYCVIRRLDSASHVIRIRSKLRTHHHRIFDAQNDSICWIRKYLSHKVMIIEEANPRCHSEDCKSEESVLMRCQTTRIDDTMSILVYCVMR